MEHSSPREKRNLFFVVRRQSEAFVSYYAFPLLLGTEAEEWKKAPPENKTFRECRGQLSDLKKLTAVTSSASHMLHTPS